MRSVLVDTSVVLKWFHAEGETEVEEARALLDAHQEDLLAAHVLDLSVYELGNVLLGSLRWSAVDVADQIEDVLSICGPPVVPDARSRRRAAELAEQHKLTFYDAAFAATAQVRGLPLVTADRRLLDAGLGERPARAVNRLAGVASQ